MKSWKLALLMALCPLAFAGEADVLDVVVSCDTNSVCRFDVTVRHDDGLDGTSALPNAFLT